MANVAFSIRPCRRHNDEVDRRPGRVSHMSVINRSAAASRPHLNGRSATCPRLQQCLPYTRARSRTTSADNSAASHALHTTCTRAGNVESICGSPVRKLPTLKVGTDGIAPDSSERFERATFRDDCLAVRRTGGRCTLNVRICRSIRSNVLTRSACKDGGDSPVHSSYIIESLRMSACWSTDRTAPSLLTNRGRTLSLQMSSRAIVWLGDADVVRPSNCCQMSSSVCSSTSSSDVSMPIPTGDSFRSPAG
jgi:hypothetical protein